MTLAACATGPENPMTAEQRRSLAIDEVQVALAPDAEIWWGGAEEEYAASQGCERANEVARNNREVGSSSSGDNQASSCDYDAIISTSEGRAYVRDKVRQRLKSALLKEVPPAFRGNAPATLDVAVKQVYVVSAGQTILVGGNHTLVADMTVIDRESGHPIARYPDLSVFAGGAGGLLGLAIEAASSDPYDRLTEDYAEEVREWLQETEDR